MTRNYDYDAEVIIIGAGIAGLSAHHELSRNGVKTIILEKSRGQGGRCATRRGEHFIADHGAQFFTIKNPSWASITKKHENSLHPIILSNTFTHPRYIHPSGISAISRFFDARDSLKNLEKVNLIHYSTEKNRYEIKTESENLYTAKNVILTAPVPQSLELLDASRLKIHHSETESKLRAIQYDSCFALIIGLAAPIELGSSGILKYPNADFAGIYNQSEKGINTSSPALVAHASPLLSEALWNEHPDQARAILVSKIEHYFLSIGIRLESKHIDLHRWKYSEPKTCFEQPYVFLRSAGQELALAGDSFARSSVEGAFESGLGAAQALLKQGV